MNQRSNSIIDLESANDKRLIEPRVRPTAYLDGLRGLAALLVYLSHHVAWWYGPDPAYELGFGYHGEYVLATFPFVRNVFSGGSAAVALFFVMSGYVLSQSPLRMLRQGKVKDTRSYLLAASIRRPFRLFLPVAALSLVFVAMLHLPFGLSPELEWPKPEATITAELWKWIREMSYMMNIFVRHRISTPWFPYNPPVWTMAAELEGSLYLFGLLAASASVTPSQRLGIFSLTGLCLLLLIYKWEVAAFMFGAALAILDSHGKSLLPNSLASWTSVINHLIFFMGWYLLGQPSGGKESERSSATPGWYYLTTYLTPPGYFRDEFWRFWTIIGATLVLYAVTRIPWLQRTFHRPIFRYLGKISFCFYLVHIPIAWYIGDRIARAFGRFRFDFATPFDNLLPIPDYGPLGISTGFLIWQASLLPINVYIASVVTKRIDEPSVRFGKWLTTNIGYWVKA